MEAILNEVKYRAQLLIRESKDYWYDVGNEEPTELLAKQRYGRCISPFDVAVRILKITRTVEVVDSQGLVDEQDSRHDRNMDAL